MTENRRLALGVALNEYFSEPPTIEKYEGIDIDELMAMEDDGDTCVWQPFENWPLDDVCGEIESLADAVERALETKESYIKEMLLNMDSDQVFDYVN